MSDTTTRVMISRRVWSFLEGTQAFADVRAETLGSEAISFENPADLSLLRKVYGAPVTRKDGRFAVDLTDAEIDGLVRYMEAFQQGAADNTWDADGRADLFAANSILTQLRKAGFGYGAAPRA